MSPPEEVIIPVSELARRMKHAVGAVLKREWIEGEIASLKQAPSGHAYFSLKDPGEQAMIDCVMYRANAQRAWRGLQEGARIQAQGKPDLWIPRGRLQFVVDRLRPAGRGSQLEALEQLKLKLAAEGLFADERKRALPSSPRVIGVVTSEHGAAIHDIVSVAFRRGGAHLVLAPAVVQGDQAVRSLLAAVALIERHPELDVLIIGRGGGSGEDLMAFNDERLVRRLAEVRVPIVSAVGHEIDITLTDLVADIRAATPSQAAELVVADRGARQRELGLAARRLRQAMLSRLRDDRLVLERLEQRLGDPTRVLGAQAQLLDELNERLLAHAHARLRTSRAELARLDRRLLLRDPISVLERTRGKLGPLRVRLAARIHERLQRLRGEQHELRQRLGRSAWDDLEQRRRRLGSAATRLDGLSPLAVLSRGYALASREGKLIAAASELCVGDELSVRLAAGSVRSQVLSVHPELEPSAASRAQGTEPR